MRFKSLTILITFCLWTGFPGKSTAQEVYHNAELGFSITKPEGWSYLSGESFESRRDLVRLDDEELEAFFKEYRKMYGTAPFVLFARYPEPHPDFNPQIAVKASITITEGLPLKKIMSVMIITLLKRMFSDLEIVEGVEDWEVDGLTVASVKMKYTANDVIGRKFPVMTRMWMISRGNVTFIVSMIGPQEGPDVSEETFLEVFESIQIDP